MTADGEMRISQKVGSLVNGRQARNESSDFVSCVKLRTFSLSTEDPSCLILDILQVSASDQNDENKERNNFKNTHTIKQQLVNRFAAVTNGTNGGM
ncbi:hypothetical protein BaRGS_00012383, partial [Batillaria attramentaria]